MKRVLIVSPHFPPINAPDMQRVRMGLPYYRASGWEAVVLAVDPRDISGVLEPELLATVPADVRVVHCRAWPLEWSRRVGMGTIGHRSLGALYRTGARLLRHERFDLVFFSSTQFTSFVLGPVWRRRFGVPFVVDVQDPWRTDYYERPGSRRPPGGWKYRLARLQASVLEGPVFRRAAGMMSVSSRYLDELRARYPDLAAPSAVIPFGASAADLAAAKQGSPGQAAGSRRPGCIHLLYTGASGPVMPHALTVLFEALALYRRRQPDRAARLRFQFYGTSYVAPGQGRNSVMPLAETLGVADQVEEIPHRLGHLECIRLQSEADVLLLPGSSDLAYSPSKLYPYYLSGKPILALVFQGSVLEQVVNELDCARVATFSEHGPKAEAHEALGRFFDDAVAGFPPGTLPPRNDARFNERYLAESLTGRQCQLFEQALRHASAGAPRA